MFCHVSSIDERYSTYEDFLDNDGTPDYTDIENRGVPRPGCEHREVPRGSLENDNLVGDRLAHRIVGAVTSALDVTHEMRTTINMNILREMRRRS